MGLDLVEIAMTVEAEFGIALADTQAAEIRTAGDLHKYVVERLNERESHRCLTAFVFYRFRAALTGRLAIPRNKVRLHSELAALIPRRRRRALWRDIGRTNGLTMPQLEYPIGLKTLCLGLLTCAVLLVFGSILRAAFLGFPADFFAPFAVAATAGAVLVALCLACLQWATAPFKARFPKDCTTVADAVRLIVNKNFGGVKARSRTWSEEEVWVKLRRIIADVAGLKPEMVTREAELYRDLGLQ